MDPVPKIVNEAQTLTAARDLAGLRKLAKRIAPFCEPALATYYISGRDALVNADDGMLAVLGQAIELRLKSLEIIRGVAKTLARLARARTRRRAAR